MRVGFVSLLLAVIWTSLVLGQVEEDSLTVTLFYESYCPFCIQYIENNIYKAWTSFKSKVLFDLVPFGNTEQRYVDGHWTFTCQHGIKECIANKLHACAVDQACGDLGTLGCAADKLGPVMDFILCLIMKPDQLRATKTCAKDTGLDGDAITSCAKGDRGDTLLNLYGNRTLAFRPQIRGVPTVAINGQQDQAAEYDLKKEICKLRPALCPNLVV